MVTISKVSRIRLRIAHLVQREYLPARAIAIAIAIASCIILDISSIHNDHHRIAHSGPDTGLQALELLALGAELAQQLSRSHIMIAVVWYLLLKLRKDPGRGTTLLCVCLVELLVQLHELFVDIEHLAIGIALLLERGDLALLLGELVFQRLDLAT